MDTLARAVLDALTDGGAVEDDARVVQLVASKHYGRGWTGATIAIARAAQPLAS